MRMRCPGEVAVMGEEVAMARPAEVCGAWLDVGCGTGPGGGGPWTA
jgi:hypothetical protein